jgi:hypothetical protein
MIKYEASERRKVVRDKLEAQLGLDRLDRTAGVAVRLRRPIGRGQDGIAWARPWGGESVLDQPAPELRQDRGCRCCPS